MFYTDDFYKKLLNKKIKAIPENFFKALDHVYKDRWCIDEESIISDFKFRIENYTTKDFISNLHYKYTIPILIHIPELTIRNEKSSHLITDLYLKIKITIKEESVYNMEIRGRRGSSTIEELKYYYRHSHLPSDAPNIGFTQFCFGSNNDLYSSRNYLIENSDVTLEDCLLFFFSLNQSLQWESKEGRPYIYFDRIAKTPITAEIPKYVVDDICRYKLKSLKNLQYKVTNNKIEVIPTQDLEDQVFNILKDTAYRNYTCYKAENKEYLEPSHLTSHIPEKYSIYEGMELFKFKNETVKFKINNIINDNNYTENNAPYPKLTENICTYLSTKITEVCIINSGIKRENAIEDTNICSEQDQILVLQDT